MYHVICTICIIRIFPVAILAQNNQGHHCFIDVYRTILFSLPLIIMSSFGDLESSFGDVGDDNGDAGIMRAGRRSTVASGIGLGLDSEQLAHAKNNCDESNERS